MIFIKLCFLSVPPDPIKISFFKLTDLCFAKILFNKIYFVPWKILFFLFVNFFLKYLIPLNIIALFKFGLFTSSINKVFIHFLFSINFFILLSIPNGVSKMKISFLEINFNLSLKLLL